MPDPINIIIKGIVITEVSGFRYGQQLHEQRFFELKFRQALLGSPFSFGTDDAESYINQPITLQFEDAFGKIKSVSGTIVRLEFTNTARQPAEVIVSGTTYQPSGNLSKFALALIALLALPLLFTGILLAYVSHLSGSLVKTEGTVSSFQESGGKGSHTYRFKIAPYSASFFRSYHTPVFNTAHKNIDDLFYDGDGSYNSNRTGQRAACYILKNDLTKLDNPREEVEFFYMQSPSKQYVKFDFYYDILVYITAKTWFYFVWVAYLFAEVCCFAAALFCYKMYALNQQQKSRFIWYACMVVAAIFNVAVLSMLL